MFLGLGTQASKQHTWPNNHLGMPLSNIEYSTMDVTKPYKSTMFGAMDVTKPYNFIGLGANKHFGIPVTQQGPTLPST
jgi:hypothetical protein